MKSLGSKAKIGNLDHTPAPIVLLFGTSSAGKGTIIEELKNQNSHKSENERLDWQEDGSDLALKKHINKIIDGNQQSKKIFNSLSDKKFSEMEILEPIFKGKLKVGNSELSLLEEVSEANMDAFISKLSESKQSLYTKENIGNLQKLATTHQSVFAENEPIARLQEVFGRAVNNSQKGVPTILDFIPLGGYDTVQKFRDYMEERKLYCPLIVAVAHCDVSKVIEHMAARNASAQPGEERSDFSPFKQYGRMYRAAKDDETVIGELTPEEIFNAAAKFGGSVEDAKTLLSNLGIAEDVDPKKPVKITTNLPHDLLLQTDPRNAEIESGVGAPKAIKESAQLINETVKGRSISNAAEVGDDKKSDHRDDAETENAWVKKLGLEDKSEKPRSFVEAAQAGKYGKMKSPGGAHEL